MAGDWIKMGVALRTHPKVVRMMSALQADRFRVIGGLFAVWSVFDQHSEDGILDGYSLAAMDDEIGWPGFSSAMQSIGWLNSDDDSLFAPRFEEHNGASAKRRAQDTASKGQRRKASASCPFDVREVSASEADKVRTREEKRREELIPPVVPRVAKSATPTVPCPLDRIVELYHELLPTLPRAKLMPKARERAIRKLWVWVLTSRKSDDTPRATNADEALGWIRGYFARAAENDFLMGRGHRSAEHLNWQCDIDFLLTDKGMKHVIEKTLDAAA